jgi:hypothetical protein
VRTVFSGEPWVHYGQIYVQSDPDSLNPMLEDAFLGQVNGLCGAAAPGSLFLTTGLHTGRVGLAVEVHESAPELDGAWEETVEVSFTPASPATRLVQWAGEASWPLDLAQVNYQVRFRASGMDAAHAADTRLDGQPQLDRYLLQLWPAPPGPERVVRQTSAYARYWHSVPASLQPRPAPTDEPPPVEIPRSSPRAAEPGR